VNDIAWVHEAARRGIGIALLPEFACKEDLQAGRLRQGLSEWSSGERPLYALYPTPRYLSRTGVGFIDMLSAGLRASRGERAWERGAPQIRPLGHRAQAYPDGLVSRVRTSVASLGGAWAWAARRSQPALPPSLANP